MKSLSKSAGLLIWSSNFWSFAEGLLGPLFAVFAQQVGGDILDIAWAWAAYLIVTGVLVIFFGYFTDRSNKITQLVVGHGLIALFTFGYLFVDTPAKLLWIQVFLGFAHALTVSPWLALMAKHSSGAHEGRSWGWADGGGKVATGLAALSGGFIVAQFGFTALFVMMGVLQLVATVYIARLYYFED